MVTVMRRQFVVVLALALYCFAWSDSSAQNPQTKSITFKDIAPIFNRNCVACHTPGNIAPMSLLSYREARPWAQQIRRKVAGREMPPWHATSGEIEFSNDRRLSEEEIETVVAWVEQGAKEGDQKNLPAPANVSEGWQVGRPDAVFSLDQDYVLNAEFVDNYIYLRIPTNFKEDRWIQAVELRPGNRRVVHHAVAFIETPEDFSQRESLSPPDTRGAKIWSLLDTPPLSIELMEGTTRRIKSDAPVIDDGCSVSDPEVLGGRNNSDVLSVYAPGREADVWPAGTAKRIPAGSNVILQMHYSKTRGSVERDRTSVGVVFAKAPVTRMVGTRSITNQMFAIPPGAANHQVTACWTYQRDVELVSFMPHMHVRGKSMMYEVIYPDARRVTLLNVPRYSFHWQTLYLLKKPLVIPSGSRVIVTAHFDNSAQNLHNPDATRTIRHGSATFDEMMIGFVNYIIPRPPDRIVIKVEPKIYDAYVGEYELDATSVVAVIVKEGKLFVEAGGRREELLPISDTTFVPKGRDSQLTFVKNEKGQVTSFITTQHDTLVRFNKKLPSQNHSR
jgi:mono/diheme cytochrome c family protein